MTGWESDKSRPANKKTESWYKEFVDHARDLIQCVDSEGRFTYVNQAWLSTLKLTAEEVDGITLWDIIHPDSLEHCMAVFEQVIKGKAAGEVEATFVTKDGIPVAVEGSVSVKLDEMGRFVHTRGIFRSITERRRAENVNRLLFDISNAVVTVQSLDNLYQSIHAALGKVMDVTNFFIAIVDMQKSTIDFPYHVDTEDDDFLSNTDFDPTVSLTGLVVSKRQPVLLEREELERRAQKGGVWGPVPLIWMGTPLMIEDEIMGILAVQSYTDADLYSEEDLRVLSAVSDQMAGAIARKKAEEELLALKNFNTRIIENIREGLIITNLEGKVTFANPATLEMLGYSSKDFIGCHWTNIVPPQYHALIEAADARRLQGNADRYELLLKHKDGALLPFQVSGSPYYNHVTGEIDGTMAVLTDISERKQAEEDLKQREEEYRTLYENIPIGVYRNTPGPQGRFLMANPGFMQLFGIKSKEELEELKVTDLYQDPAERDPLTEKLIAEGHLKGVERRLKRLDGTPFWGLTTARTVYDEQGEVAWFDCTIEDITRRKAAEEALKASEQKHREILSTIEEGYYEVDLAGNFLFYNESLCRMLGCSSEELMGVNYKRFYKNTKKVFETYNQVYKTGKPVKAIDWPAVTWDGSEVYWELSISLRHDEKGAPSGFRGVVRDITARRQSDEKIRYLSYHDQLTGLYNRHFLEEEMNRLDTERHLPISIVMTDVNGLKLVNDTYGHQTGDEMLKIAAEVLKKVCRDDDLIARFGGDEFVLYLPGTAEKEARKISERIEKACRNELIKDVPLSLSTGLAVKVSAEQDLTNLLREAEDKMYRDKLTESRSGKSAIVNSLLQTLATKSYETEAHTRNMQEAANLIGEKLGLPTYELHRLQLLITLHDIGKINIPEALLTKKGSLSADEWEIMKKHSETGYRIAKATDSFAHVAEDILAHHERWDGSGYPQGLKGEQIPLLARITAIADAYEVMSNGRPYKKAMSKREIVAELKKCAGSQFDPQLVKLFLDK